MAVATSALTVRTMVMRTFAQSDGGIQTFTGIGNRRLALHLGFEGINIQLKVVQWHMAG